MVENIVALVSSMGFSSPEAVIGLLFLVLAVIGAVIVVVSIRPVLEFYPYTSPNARVRARRGRLFDEKQLSEVVEANTLDEVKNYLRGVPEYAEYVEKYPLEKALDSQLAETHDLLARIAPDDIKETFDILLSKWDISNLKSIIIAKEAGLTREETENLLIPFGELKDSSDKLLDAKNIEEVVNALEGTEYAQVLEDAIPEYQKTGMLLPLEAALDKNYLNNLVRSVANPADDNSKLLQSYIGTLVDTTNLKIILRAKVDGLKYEEIQSYMISNGYQIREWKLKELMESEDVEGVVSSLEGTKYAHILSESMPDYTSTGSIAPLEAALDANVRKTANTISKKKPIGIGPIIGFLSRKETEVRNLKIIARGKVEDGVSTSMIKEMLV
jgi:V/A-type H+-transporting ATPase subunit C